MTPFEVFWDNLDQPIRLGNQVLAFSVTSILLELVVPLLALLLFCLLGFRWVKGYVGKTSLGDERKASVISGFRIGLRVLFGLVFLILISRFLEDRIVRLIDDVFKTVRTPFYKSGSTEISILTVILALPVFWLAYMVGKASKMAFERSRAFTHNLPESRRLSIANLIRYSVMAITFIIGLSIIGIDLSAIAIILGIMAVGVGIGLQQVLASFFSGLIIILNRPFKEGDFIRVFTDREHQEGIVKQIRMLNTAVLTLRNETVFVPNAHLLNNSVANFSLPEDYFLAQVPVMVPHDSDVEKIQECLGAIARACPYWNGLGEPSARIQSIAIEGIELVVMLQLGGAADKANAKLWLNQEIYREFRSRNFKFATAK
jgi:small-conductance mechanosensitive channel